MRVLGPDLDLGGDAAADVAVRGAGREAALTGR